jgi:uncharacterized protein (DUF1697 family)
MTTYVAMLRGINVSGRNPLSMEDLRAVVVGAGGQDVRTYIQSGNAIFTHRGRERSVRESLQRGLREALRTEIPVLVRTRQELDDVIATNPFVRRGETAGSLHVTFMGAVADPAAVEAARRRTADGDEFEVIGREIYLLCPNGYGRTKLTNAFFEKRLGSEATTRNWKTITALVALAGE